MMYTSTILLDYNHLYEIYSTFKKESKWFVVVKKEKDTKGTNNEIRASNNVNILYLRGDIDISQDNKKDKRAWGITEARLRKKEEPGAP